MGNDDDAVLYVAQVVGAFASMIAIVIAVYAAKKANRAHVAAQNALVRERRIDFELDQLTDLAQYAVLSYAVQGATAKFTAYASLLPADLIPIARAVVSLPSTPEAMAYVTSRQQGAHEASQGLRDFLKDDILAEIQRAVTRRLAERDEDEDVRPAWLARLRAVVRNPGIGWLKIRRNP